MPRYVRGRAYWAAPLRIPAALFEREAAMPTKIRLLTAVSFSQGTKQAGEVVECDEHQAKALIEAGCAEDADGGAAPEAAALAEAPERATQPRPRTRG
jgi:hypothetical protein